MFDKIHMKLILARARREERRMLRSSRGQKGGDGDALPFAPSDPDGFDVFKKVCPGTGLFIFEPVTWIIAVIVFFIALYRHPVCIPIVIGALVLLQAGQVALNHLRHHFFKGWHRRLPYHLQGWEELVRAKRMYADLCWTDIGITVETDQGSEECLDYIKAALLLFCKKSNKALYARESGFMKDHRKKWSTVTATSAAGSANTEVMRHMKGLLGRDLAMVAGKGRCITAVRIEIQSDEYEVPIEIRTSEGTAS